MGRLKSGFTLVVFMTTSACYAYSPSTVGDLNMGDEIRARLTAVQFDEIEEHIPGGDRILEGNVIEANGDGILLEVPVASTLEGMRVQSFKQRLDIPAEGITEVELRSLDRNRTYLVSGVAAALAGFIIWDQLLSDTKRGGGGGLPPPDEDRRTILSIPLIVW